MQTELASVGMEKCAPVLINADLNRLRENASSDCPHLNEWLSAIRVLEAGISSVGHRADLITLLRRK